jgi:hypothetical protein
MEVNRNTSGSKVKPLHFEQMVFVSSVMLVNDATTMILMFL